MTKGYIGVSGIPDVAGHGRSSWPSRSSIHHLRGRMGQIAVAGETSTIGHHPVRSHAQALSIVHSPSNINNESAEDMVKSMGDGLVQREI